MGLGGLGVLGVRGSGFRAWGFWGVGLRGFGSGGLGATLSSRSFNWGRVRGGGANFKRASTLPLQVLGTNNDQKIHSC